MQVTWKHYASIDGAWQHVAQGAHRRTMAGLVGGTWTCRPSAQRARSQPGPFTAGGNIRAWQAVCAMSPRVGPCLRACALPTVRAVGCSLGVVAASRVR